MATADNALDPGRIARIHAEVLASGSVPLAPREIAERETGARQALCAAAGYAEGEIFADLLAGLLRRFVPRWLRAFLRIDALARAIGDFVADTLDPDVADPSPETVEVR